jgi:hypothetical protein
MREAISFSEQRRPAVRRALHDLFELVSRAEESATGAAAIGRLGRWVMNAAIAVRQAAESTRPATDIRRARRLLAGVLEMAELLCLRDLLDAQTWCEMRRQIDRIVAGLEALPPRPEEWPAVELPPLERPSPKDVEASARPLREIRQRVGRVIHILSVMRRKRVRVDSGSGAATPTSATDTAEVAAKGNGTKPPNSSTG